jgi:hypothetical protein
VLLGGPLLRALAALAGHSHGEKAVWRKDCRRQVVRRFVEQGRTIRQESRQAEGPNHKGQTEGRISGKRRSPQGHLGILVGPSTAYSRLRHGRVSSDSVAQPRSDCGSGLYFLTPIDVIPDFIVGMGYLDDAAVIAWVMNTVKSVLNEFLKWEASRHTG